MLIWLLSLPCAYLLGFVNGVRLLGARIKTQMQNGQVAADIDRLEAAQAKVSAMNGRKS